MDDRLQSQWQHFAENCLQNDQVGHVLYSSGALIVEYDFFTGINHGKVCLSVCACHPCTCLLGMQVEYNHETDTLPFLIEFPLEIEASTGTITVVSQFGLQACQLASSPFAANRFLLLHSRFRVRSGHCDDFDQQPAASGWPNHQRRGRLLFDRDFAGLSLPPLLRVRGADQRLQLHHPPARQLGVPE